MTYHVEVQPPAQREFDRLPERVKARMTRSLSALAEDPRRPGCKPLTEGPLKGSYRIHVGREYCIGYDIDDGARLVSVWQLGNRRGFYDKAKRKRK